MADVLLILAVFLIQNSYHEDLFCGASSNMKTSLLFGYDLFCPRFESVHDHFQHHFAHMTNKVDGSVVLTDVQIPASKVLATF